MSTEEPKQEVVTPEVVDEDEIIEDEIIEEEAVKRESGLPVVRRQFRSFRDEVNTSAGNISGFQSKIVEKMKTMEQKLKNTLESLDEADRAQDSFIDEVLGRK